MTHCFGHEFPCINGMSRNWHSYYLIKGRMTNSVYSMTNIARGIAERINFSIDLNSFLSLDDFLIWPCFDRTSISGADKI